MSGSRRNSVSSGSSHSSTPSAISLQTDGARTGSVPSASTASSRRSSISGTSATSTNTENTGSSKPSDSDRSEAQRLGVETAARLRAKEAAEAARQETNAFHAAQRQEAHRVGAARIAARASMMLAQKERTGGFYPPRVAVAGPHRWLSVEQMTVPKR